MESTGPPPLQRTCPACGSRIDAVHTFCEICGAKMPDLPSCSNCGARFIAPVKFCEMCGTPVNPPVADADRQVPSAPAAPAKTAVPEQALPPGPAATPPPPREFIPSREPASKPMTSSGPLPGLRPAVQEKTTERMESAKPGQGPESRAGNEPAAHDQPAEKTETGPVTLPGEVSGTADNVLFFPPGDTGQKPPAGKGKWIAAGIVLLVVIAAGALFALPALTGKGGPSPLAGPVPSAATPLPQAIATVTPAPTPVETPAPTPTVSRALVPEPTQALPGGQKVYFQVQKDAVSARISVIYAGGTVASSVTGADVTVTQPGGAVASGIIMPQKGVNELALDGSKGADRVEILVHMTNGQTYRVYDQLLPLRS